MDQNIQRPTAEGKHLTVAPEHPFANRKFERAEPQLPMTALPDMCQPNDGFPASHMPIVGRQMRNCARVKLATTKLVGFPPLWKGTN